MPRPGKANSLLCADVEYVEPDQLLYAATTAINDPMLCSQYHLWTVEALAAWDISHGSKDVSVCVVDTGVAYT